MEKTRIRIFNLSYFHEASSNKLKEQLPHIHYDVINNPDFAIILLRQH